MYRKLAKIPNAIYERHYVYHFNFHLIWVTKYRHALFTTPALQNEFKQILQGIAKDNEINIKTMEVMPDHVHLLLSFKPKLSPSVVVKILKGGSARQFFVKHQDIKADQFWGGHLWSHSYFMSTVGEMSREVVQRYIENQHTK